MQAEILYYVFSAGVVFGIFQTVRRDLRGVGGKVSRSVARADTRQRNISIALMLLAKDEAQKQQIADLMTNEGEK